jgi:hypothetical protein
MRRKSSNVPISEASVARRFFAISTTSVIAILTSARESLRRVQALRAFFRGACVHTAYCASTALKHNIDVVRNLDLEQKKELSRKR